MIQMIVPNFLIISLILVGFIGFFGPYSTKEDSFIRSFLLISISLFFLGNVLIIDWLFLNGFSEVIGAKFTLLEVNKYSISFGLEPLGLIFLTMLATLWPCALMYTIKFLSLSKIHFSSKYLMFVNACILSGCLIALAANLFTMFIFYDVLTLCTIPLISHVKGKNVNKGLFTYLRILMISGMMLFLPAIIIIYLQIGNGDFTHGGFLSGEFTDTWAIILLLMFIFGISKAAVFPLYGWLPAAMVASYPVSALLHAVVVVKSGLFCIYKILIYVFGLQYLQYLFSDHNWLIYFPIITIIYSSLQALRSQQLKMILAYSTINQLSVALLGAFLFTTKGLNSAIVHMISHSLTKICLFYAAGSIYSIRGCYKVSDLIGTYRTMPWTSFMLLISTLSLIGIPPFAGFISKLFILMAADEAKNLPVMITLIISSVISALYMIRILIFVYKPVNVRGNKEEKKLPSLMFISLACCLSGVVLFFFILQVINIFIIYL
jgi:multicomponent Na+:H+ antiporter subunit D